MTKYRDLDSGDVLPASWTDALQEFVGTLSSNLRLRLQAANVVEAAAAAGSSQASVGPGGLWRYRTTSATATVSGVAGTKDIYVVASANSFAVTPDPDTDNTDYNWYLQVLGSGVTPTGNTPLGNLITAYTKVGELRWDGTTTVTWMRQTHGAQDTTLPVSPIASQPGQVPLQAVGATAQTAALLAARIGLTGTDVFTVGADGTITSAVGVVAGTTLTAGTFVNSPAYRVSGTALAASHLSNGTTGTGAVVLAASAALTGTPTAPTAATASNDTTIATTALVAAKITAAIGGGGGSSFASLSLTGTGKTTLLFPDTTTTTGMTFGGDTTLYRNAADTLKTDDSLIVGTNFSVTGTATFTVGPTAPTAAVDTNTTQLATTAFVVAQASSSNPAMDGAVAIGTSLRYARADHVHASDTSRAPLASPTFTGVPAAPTATGGTNTTQIATTAFVTAAVTAGGSPDATTLVKGIVQLAGDLTGTAALPTIKSSVALTGAPTAATAAADTNTTQLATTAFVIGQASATNPVMNGAVAIGTSLRYARSDHVHASDTSRAPLASPTFTGVPAAPTAAVDTNTTQLATTAFVIGQGYSKLASPTFTGSPAAPTAAPGTSTTQLATTAFVTTAGNLKANIASPTFTGTVNAPTLQDGSGLNYIKEGNSALFANVAYLLQVRDTGEVNQLRAGRVLVPADFVSSIGIYNLSNVNDSSGLANTLTNKGSVTFGSGITGAATEAAIFTGSTAQALYNTGTEPQFRIRTGSWGCWVRTAKRGTIQYAWGKWNVSGQACYLLGMGPTNGAAAYTSTDGSVSISASGSTDIADDRWHFLVATHDGAKLRLYVDGALDGSITSSGLIFAGTAPVNVGGYGANAATAASSPWFGRVDEAFVTAHVLSEDGVRYLYAASKTFNNIGTSPMSCVVAVEHGTRGVQLNTTDFPVAGNVQRLYNLAGSTLGDAGVNNVTLSVSTGTAVQIGVSGPSDAYNDAVFLQAASLQGTDTGLPSGSATRSFGGWFKTTSLAGVTAISWGGTAAGTGDTRININSSGQAVAANGADVITGSFVADGNWHFAVVVEDLNASDALRRKLYVDGRCVGNSTAMNTIVLSGANRFHIGANNDNTQLFTGSVARMFVTSDALTPEQIHKLYNTAGQGGAIVGVAEPKNAGDHVVDMIDGRVLLINDTLQGSDFITVKAAA